MGFTILLYYMNHNQIKQTVPMNESKWKGLRFRAHLSLLLKVIRLTKLTLIIYFHETKIIAATRFHNQIILIEALTIFMPGGSIAYKVALIQPLIMLPITINNKNPENMIKDTNFNLERKRKKEKEHILIDSRNNRANLYQN